MTVSSIRGEIERLLVSLLRSNLALGTQAVIVRSDSGRSTVTWAGGSGPAFILENPTATIFEYRRFLRDGQYSCVLRDGSLIQISVTLERDRVVKHRFVFFPCPLLFDEADLSAATDFPFSDIFDIALEDELAPDGKALEPDATRGDARLRLRSPLRFDYDIAAMATGHPGSHLHLSDEDVRWAMFGPLSIGHFVRFVFRHFYHSAWAEHQFLREWPLQYGSRSVTTLEERELFIDCRAASDHQDVA